MPRQVMKEAFNLRERRYFIMLKFAQLMLISALLVAGFVGITRN